jgi:hypothetical protein
MPVSSRALARRSQFTWQQQKAARLRLAMGEVVQLGLSGFFARRYFACLGECVILHSRG